MPLEFLHVSEMASEVLYKAVVLKLVFQLLLTDFFPHCGASSFLELADLENDIACDGEHFMTHCANPSLGLHIYSAFYGRTDPGHVLCPYNGQNNDKKFKCNETNVTVKFKTLCGGRNKCRVKINAALFGDPCPQKKHKHLYLSLVYTCKLYGRLRRPLLNLPKSTETTSTSILSAPTSSLVSSSSVSMAISPTATSLSPSSSIPLTTSTPTVENIPKIISPNTKEDIIIMDTSSVGEVGSSSDTNARSLGIADHGSDYITVFFASAAGAVVLAIIIGIFIYYRHNENKQHLHVKELPKLNAYGTVERKMLPEVDPFISGPIKTPPPDCMMEGYNYNWQRGGTSPPKKSENGTFVGKFSPKDVPTKDMNGESTL